MMVLVCPEETLQDLKMCLRFLILSSPYLSSSSAYGIKMNPSPLLTHLEQTNRKT
jgi:hypothetical protein